MSDKFRITVEKNKYENNNIIANKLSSIIKEDTRFMCIGTDKHIGDVLGPYIGTLLNNDADFNYKLYGTLDNPVHAKNIEDISKQVLKEQQQEGFDIIAIDACVGIDAHLGTIIFNDGFIRPGAGVDKVLTRIGDYCIKGITAKDVFEMKLNIVRFKEIYYMAHFIYKQIMSAININRGECNEDIEL